MNDLAKFSSKWSHPQYPPRVIAAVDLDRPEEQLGLKLPTDYRDAILHVGLPCPTGALLHSICEVEADFADVAEFLSAEEIISATQHWREMGLPDGMVAFAADCMGNLFVFSSALISDGSAVWFFDHDSGETRQIAPSFGQWLQPYLDLAYVPLDDF